MAGLAEVPWRERKFRRHWRIAAPFMADACDRDVGLASHSSHLTKFLLGYQDRFLYLAGHFWIS
jgi:hypothetical protein